MTDWKEYRLGDLISIKHGYAFPGSGITSVDNGIVLVTPGNFNIGGGFKEEKCKFFSDNYPNEYVLRSGDLIVTMTDLSREIDTLGYGAIVPSNPSRIYLHNQRIGLVNILEPSIINQSFLSFLLRTDKYQKWVAGCSSGTTVHHTSPSKIYEYKVEIPPLAEQKKIAAILSSLDEKIETNRKINARLEELAQALFKSWFIDFEPFGGQMPPDWEIVSLNDILTVKYGKDHKQLADGDYPLYGSGGIMRYVERPLYKEESVLIPRKGSLNNIIYVDEPFWSVDTMFFTEMKKLNIAKYVYYQLKRMDFESMNCGSAIPSMSTSILNAIRINLPSEQVLCKFEDNINPLFARIKSLNKESTRLAELRDALLPKLMSGEIIPE